MRQLDGSGCKGEERRKRSEGSVGRERVRAERRKRNRGATYGMRINELTRVKMKKRKIKSSESKSDCFLSSISTPYIHIHTSSTPSSLLCPLASLLRLCLLTSSFCCRRFDASRCRCLMPMLHADIVVAERLDRWMGGGGLWEGKATKGNER